MLDRGAGKASMRTLMFEGRSSALKRLDCFRFSFELGKRFWRLILKEVPHLNSALGSNF